MTLSTWGDFLKVVAEMRKAQKESEKRHTVSGQYLKKELETKVDDCVEYIKEKQAHDEQKELF